MAFQSYTSVANKCKVCTIRLYREASHGKRSIDTMMSFGVKYILRRDIVTLTTVTEKNCVLLNSVQESIEIEARMLLTFFICVHNQLSYAHSIVKC